MLFGPLLSVAHNPISRAFGFLLKGVKPFGDQAFAIYATIGPHSDRDALREPGMKEVFLDDLLPTVGHGVGQQPALGDIDGDGADEVVVVGSNGPLYVLRGDGRNGLAPGYCILSITDPADPHEGLPNAVGA